jgi:predicted enzyme related to lactoylglutathione lyase
MSEANFEILDITIDCADPDRLGAFWSDVLGRRVDGRRGPYLWLERLPGGIGFGFQKVAEPKVQKNRVHLDIAASDLVGAKARIEELGGSRVQGYESGGFLVMADPEGNEFCLIPVEPFEFDDNGRTNYLNGIDAT